MTMRFFCPFFFFFFGFSSLRQACTCESQCMCVCVERNLLPVNLCGVCVSVNVKKIGLESH